MFKLDAIHSTRSILSLGLLAALLAGCAAETAGDETAEDVGEASEELSVDTGDFQDSSFSVCWEDHDHGPQKKLVREVAEGTWSREARVTFTGWNLCEQGGGHLHINFTTEDRGYTEVDSIFSGFDWDMYIPDWDHDNPDWYRNTIAHEFGHALGFRHEQNRADTPAQYQGSVCGDGDDASANATYGPWDLYSVMNYCNPDQRGVLSGWDTEGVRFYYGPKQTGSLVSRNGSRCADVTGASWANGVQIQTWGCGAGSEQRFLFEFTGRRMRRADDVTKCLAPVGPSSMVQQLACDSSSAQKWTYFDMNTTTLLPRIRGIAGKCLKRIPSGEIGKALWIGMCTASSEEIFSYKEETGEIVDANGKCVDVKNGGMANGTPVQMWDCIGSQAQKWTYLENGVFRSALGKCMDLAGGNSADGTEVQTWDCNGSGTQSWNPHVGMQIRGIGGKCLAMTQDTGAANVPAKMMYCSNSTAQRWVYSTVSQTLKNQFGQCLQPSGGSSASSTPLVAQPCTGGSSQKWALTGNGVISHLSSGRCLDVRNSNPDGGAVAQIYDCNGTNAQKWSLSGVIKNNSGQCLDVTNGDRDNGAPIRTYTCVPNAPAQQWDAYF